MSFTKLLEKFRKEASNKREQGILFEKFTQKYLTISTLYKNIYEEVWLWQDFPYKDGADTGIDLVAKHKYEDKYTAIQCKFFEDGSTIHKNDIDSFLACSGKSFDINGVRHYFSNRMIVTTASNWGKNVQSTLEKQQIPTSRIDFNDFLYDENIDWSAFSIDNIETLQEKHNKKSLRPHQRQAIDNILKGFETADRGKLIMACGTGKTFTSLKLAETFGIGSKILFLAPSISLVSQNIKEWLSETSIEIGCIPVCSDSSVGKKDEDSIGSNLSEFQYPASTNVDDFVARYKSMPDNVMKVVFSTYQSIDVIDKGQKQCDFEFDLIICDEAHRTAGAKSSKDNESYFTKIHNNDFIKGKKRIYMTATPKVYSENIKKKAENNDVILWSMDDEEVYGKELYKLGFGSAVENNLLTDYKVVILSVSQSYVHKYFQHNITETPDVDDYGKIIGLWNALSKHNLVDITTYTEQNDPEPMKRAVVFTGTIKASKDFNNMIKEASTIFDYKAKGLVKLDVDHIDGSMSNIERNSKLHYLKEMPEDNTCKILSNARCLSEGIDVPSLDAVVFLSPKNSMVDIVQSIGRVMRKSPNKKYGYIILPVVIPDDVPPEVALNDNDKYSIIWNVLQALRSHDDRFENIVNSLKFNKKNEKRIISDSIGFDGEDTVVTSHDLDLEIGFHETLTDALYNKIVQKCGDKIYWEKWASEVTDLAKLHIKTINELLESNENTKQSFNTFLHVLRANLNNDISQDDAIEMISQHLITKPIFEALFSSYSFVDNNPVSKAISEILNNIDDGRLIKGSTKLNKFYESVKKKVASIQTAEERQMIIKELYSKFFKLAFKSASEKLGIVYTPVEAVDFIIKAVEYGLNKHFNKSISDKDIHIIDPFTGTGTFITRLLQSGLIKKEMLEYKYKNEIHANELVLLAYYIAAINIEETYHTLKDNEEYTPFDGIVLTDTFQLAETQGSIIDINERNFLKENSSRLIKQKNAPIKVIIGNPPYSVGQKSENDNNKNTRYEKLENAIARQYIIDNMPLNNKNKIYDSYIKAFRWATDRLDDNGIICFITNNGYIDNNAFDGFRKCLREDFSYIYCFDLKGNIRLHNKDEGENIFGSESMTGIAILLLIKDKSKKEPAIIKYSGIPNNLKTAEKLNYIANNDMNTLTWQEIIPDKNNDWLNLRNDEFEKFIATGDKKSNIDKNIFKEYTSGIKTNRDTWDYNFSSNNLKKNILYMINNYNMEVVKFSNGYKENEINNDSTKINWDGTLKQHLKKGKNIIYNNQNVTISTYRPFSKRYLYFQKEVINSTYKNFIVFPTQKHKNIIIAISGVRASSNFSVLMTNDIVSMDTVSKTQCFPLYYYTKYDTGNAIENLNDEVDEYGYKKEYAITDYALNEYQKRYGSELGKEDIFYYIYDILHNTEYRQKYSNDLKKTLARIPFVKTVDDFNAYSKAGRDLAEIHLNYETIEPYKLDEESKDNPSYKVEKMKWNKDKTELRFNKDILFKNIPKRVYKYVINGKSPIEWIADQYQVSIDKASQIKNDPNEYSTDEKYIYNLVKRVVTVSLKTLDIIDNLPQFDVE